MKKMIITVGATKGGVGKTTLAIQLALHAVQRGMRVMLIDADVQASASTALDDVQHDRLTVVRHAKQDSGVRAQRESASHDVVIIDAGGRDNAALRSAIVYSDRLVVPTQPRSFDVWGLDDMSALVEVANASRSSQKIEAMVVVNMADVQPASRDNIETISLANSIPGMRVLERCIGRRKSIAAASSSGKPVSEHKPRDERAIDELAAFCDAVLGP